MNPYKCKLCKFNTYCSSKYKTHLNTQKHKHNEKSTYKHRLNSHKEKSYNPFILIM